MAHEQRGARTLDHNLHAPAAASGVLLCVCVCVCVCVFVCQCVCVLLAGVVTFPNNSQFKTDTNSHALLRCLQGGFDGGVVGYSRCIA